MRKTTHQKNKNYKKELNTGGWAVFTVHDQQMEAYSVTLVTPNMTIRGEMENQTVTHLPVYQRRLHTMTMFD